MYMINYMQMGYGTLCMLQRIFIFLNTVYCKCIVIQLYSNFFCPFKDYVVA